MTSGVIRKRDMRLARAEERDMETGSLFYSCFCFFSLSLTLSFTIRGIFSSFLEVVLFSIPFSFLMCVCVSPSWSLPSLSALFPTPIARQVCCVRTCSRGLLQLIGEESGLLDLWDPDISHGTSGRRDISVKETTSMPVVFCLSSFFLDSKRTREADSSS